MTEAPSQLALVRASKSRPSGEWSADDCDVREGDTSGRVVGRIMLTPQGPAGAPWFWTITRAPQAAHERGYAASRDAAMAAFRAAFDPMPDGDPEALIEWVRRNIQSD